MRRIPSCRATKVVALFATITLAPGAQAASTVVLDVPQLFTADSARGFEFVSFQFNVYLVPIGDPVSDYSANVLANDYENYTYIHASGGGSGRGGGYRPPTYVRGPAATYSDTYQNVTRQPGELDAFFHFSGADVAGLPLAVTVSDSGTYSLNLTADDDATHSPLVPGTPLENGLYTLEYQTDSLLGSQVTFTSTALPGDFNNDGVVDGADYIVWRRGLGKTYTQSDYNVWRSHVGQTASGGSGAIANAAVPEPATLVMLVAGILTIRSRRRITASKSHASVRRAEIGPM